ncbi:MAG: peptidylprolyl isomerase [Aggregatilineales bacterium]
MPSNSKSRSKSRSARSRAQARKAQQQNQSALIVGGVAVAAVIVIGLFLLSRNGGNTSTGSSGATTPVAGAQFTPRNAEDPSSPCYNATPPNTPAPVNAPKQFSVAPPQTIDPTHTYCAFLTTAHGIIVIELYAKSAPKHVNSFVFLASQGYFDGITWHRVIPGFMAQTGDPTGTGFGGPGYSLPLEIDPSLRYDGPGVLGMARTSAPNSAGSQFFITFAPQPNLDPTTGSPGYTIFGHVVKGMSVLQQVAIRNVDQNPNATLPPGDTLISVRTLDVTAGK